MCYLVKIISPFWLKSRNENVIGDATSNPILDTRMNELEFPDSRIEEYSVNVIAEKFLNMSDADVWEGHWNS